MKPLLIAILISTAVQAQTYITKDSLGNSFLNIDDGNNFIVMPYDDYKREPVQPFEFIEIPDHGIKPSTTVWPEAEIFIINHPEVGERSDLPSFSLDNLINALSFGGLVFASVWWLIGAVLKIRIV